MQLTFEIRRQREQEAQDELLLRTPLEVEGLEQPPTLERPAYIDLFITLNTDEQQAAEESTSVAEATKPTPTPQAAKPNTPAPANPAQPPAPVLADSFSATPPTASTSDTPDIAFEPQLLPPPSFTPPRLPAPTTVAEFRANVERATAALPFLPMPPERKLSGGGAAASLPPVSKATFVPKPPPVAPRPTPQNPVPKPIWEVEQAAYKTLPNRPVMALTPRPASKITGVPAPTTPNLDDAIRAVNDPIKFNELRTIARAQKPVTVTKATDATPLTVEQSLNNLFSEMTSAPTEPKASKGTARPPRGLEHSEEFDPSIYLKGDKDEKDKETRATVDPAEAARVWARLLAAPDKIAENSLTSIRETMYPNHVVQRNFPEAGNTHKDSLAADLTKHFRAVAEASVGNAQTLDAAIEIRRQEAANQIKVAALGESKAITELAQKTADQQAATKAQLEADKQAATTKANKARAAIKATPPPETTTETRDRLISEVRTKVSTAMVRFLAMETRRKSDTDNLEYRHIKACEFAAQKDELTILNTMAAGTDRDNAVAEIQTWLTTTKQQIKKQFDEYRFGDANELFAFRGKLYVAADAAFLAIRVWSDTTQGYHIEDSLREEEAKKDRVDLKEAIDKASAQLDIEKLAQAANSRFQILGDLKTAATDEARKKALLAGEGINNEQRQLVQAAYGPNPGDAYQMLADKILEETLAPKRAALFPSIKAEILASDNWEGLDAIAIEIGGKEAGGVESRADAIREASEGYTSDDDAETMLKSLEGLNEFSIRALQLCYVAKYNTSLDSDLKADLDDDIIAKEEGQLDRANGLIEQAKQSTWKHEPQFAKNAADPTNTSPYANTKALREAKADALAAEIFRHGKGQWGTKEGETIAAVGTVQTKEERDLLEERYQKKYKSSLRQDLEEELNDWSTTAGHNENGLDKPTSHDAARAIALLDLDKARARAIQIDQEAFYDQWGRGDRDDVEKIYKEVEDEVRAEAARSGKSAAWVKQEIKRRLGEITTSYDRMYQGATLPYFVPKDPNDPNSPLVQARRGSLAENFKSQFGPYDGEVLIKESEYDKAGANAARMLAEKKSFYVDDELSNKIFLETQERARNDFALDNEPRLRFLAQEKMRLEEDAHFRSTGRFWTPRERYEKKQRMDVQLERDIDNLSHVAAKAEMDSLGASYKKISGGDSLEDYIESGMSGYDALFASKIAANGYLSPQDQIKLAILGPGTNEPLLKQNLSKLTKEELIDLDDEWQYTYGESLYQALDDDLSGDDWIDAKVSLAYGRPLTIDAAIHAAEYREKLTRPGDTATAAVFLFGNGDVNSATQNSLASLRNLAAYMDSPAVANLTPEQQESWLNSFDTGVALVNEAITTRNSIVSSVTDSVVNAVSMVVAVVVGALLSPFTGGLSAVAAAALVSSLAATVSSVALRRIMLGARYGSGQIAMDLAIGVVDAVVAVLTAGLGNKLLGMKQAVNMAVLKSTVVAARKGSTKAMLQLMLFKLGSSGRLIKGVGPVPFLQKMAAKESSFLSRAIAEGIAQSAENAVQSVPSALVTNIANEDNWRSGNPFGNILLGTIQQVGASTGQGLAFHYGMSAVGPAASRAFELAQGPKLGTETYKTSGPEAIAQQKLREDVIHELHYARPEGNFDGIPVTELSAADYLRAVGIGKPDAAIIIRDGQLHVVVREGGDISHVHALADGIHQRVEAGTGGRLNETHLRETLPSRLKDNVKVIVDHSLDPFEIKVSPRPPVEVRVGPNVSAKSYNNHLKIAAAVLALDGASGRVAKLLEQVKVWTLEHGTPPRGSVGEIAHFEVRKLPTEIEAIQQQLRNPDLNPHEVIRLEDQLANLYDQLATHKSNLDNFDLAPADAFIAVLGDPPIFKTEMPASLADIYLKSTPIDNSPLKNREGIVSVVQIGERKGNYRMVAALDANGKIKALHEERFGDGNWKMRGAESPYRGFLTEKASAAYDAEMQQKNPSDIILTSQNSRNNGFDRIIIKFETDAKGKVTPRLVIVEDKGNFDISSERFSALTDDRLAKNFKALLKGELPATKGKKGASLELPDGTKVTPEIIQHIKDAVAAKKVSLELRVLDEAALGTGAAMDRLKGLIQSRKIAGFDFKHLEISSKVIPEEHINKAFEDYFNARYIKQEFPVQQRLRQLTGDPSPTPTPDLLRSEGFVRNYPHPTEKGMPNARFLDNPLKVDGARIVTDGTGQSFLHIDVRPPSTLLATPNYAKEILQVMGTEVLDKVANKLNKPQAILNLDGWTPKQIDKLKNALIIAANGDTAALARIKVFPNKKGAAENLFPTPIPKKPKK